MGAVWDGDAGRAIGGRRGERCVATSDSGVGEAYNAAIGRIGAGLGARGSGVVRCWGLVMAEQRAGSDGTASEGWRALDYFTDRHAAIRTFLSYLNDEPAKASVLFFRGPGGNGKTLLMRFFQTRCCKRFGADDWAYLRGLEDEEFEEHVVGAEGAAVAPSGRLDFQQGTEDVLGLLQQMRHQLAVQGYRFPLFNYACVRYWRETGQLSDDKLKSAFPDDELDLAVEVAGALTDAVPGLSAVPSLVRVINRRLGDPLRKHRLQRRLDEAQLGEILRLDYQTELLDRLPVLFAADLNAAKKLDTERPRVALFFDTHERFWGQIRDVDPGSHHGRDAWLRRLLAALDRTGGIVTVVAGRESPSWEKAPAWKVENLDLHDVTEFTDADAVKFLVRRGVTDTDLYPSLLAIGRVGPNRIHPFFLGVAVDIAVRAADGGQPLSPDELAVSPGIDDGGKSVVERLLRYVDVDLRYAIRALSACRAFSWEICRYLSDQRGYGVTRGKFDILRQFSFVTPNSQATNRPFQMHELLRRLFREQHDAETRAADATLERYYRDRVDMDGATALAEAIYHANQQDWQRGVEEWAERFEQALRYSRYDECRALADVREELEIESRWWYGRVSSLAGEFAARLSQHDVAETAFRAAIAAHAAVADDDDTDLAAFNSLGVTLQVLGDLLARQAEHAQAADAYQQSIAAFDQALRLAPDFINALWGRGWTLDRLGSLVLEAGGADGRDDACRSFVAARESLRRAVRIAPKHADVRARLDGVMERLREAGCGGEDGEADAVLTGREG